MAPHDKHNQLNLLLNLILQEYNDWYYFETTPRYDDDLASYMQLQSETAFVRINLKNPNATIYYPLAYHSLSGFQLFGNNPGWRREGSDIIITIAPEVALNHLVKEIYPDLNRATIYHKLDQLTTNYENAINLELEQYVSPQYLLSAQDHAHICACQESFSKEDLHASALFFNAYGDQNSCELLYASISSFSEDKGIAKDTAARLWVESYIASLLKTVMNLYRKGIILTPNHLQTGLLLNEKGLPDRIVFTGNPAGVNIARLAENYNQEKLDHFMAAQLLLHHIYPLIRGIGMLGFIAEENLLISLNQVITEIKLEYGKKADFLHAVQLKTTALVSVLLNKEEDDEYARKQLHLHNHVINTRYYAKELIKPNPGEMVHKRYFNGGELEIGIRGFNPQTDIEVLHEWVNMEYTKKFWEMDGPIRNLEEAYIKHLGVDYSHPYIGTLNGEPIFTLELYWAIKDEVGKYYPFQAGDYGFHMLIAPAKQKIPNFSYYALTMCMEHFFSFDKVHRMIGEASAEHMGTHNLITKVGCEFERALVLPYKTSNLTFCKRAQFQEATKDVFARSCTEIFVNI